jgi:hypothetical protein
VAVLGFALTLVLPEPAGLSLDDIAALAPATRTRGAATAPRSRVIRNVP